MYDKHTALPLSEQRAAGFPPTGWRPRPGQPGSRGCGGAPCPAVRSKCLWICARHTACPLSLSNDPSGDSCLRNPLHKQQSLPLRPVIPLVARISDQNASGAPPMTVREKTRLEKFRQLLSSHNTDLGEYCNPTPPRPAPVSPGQADLSVTGILRDPEATALYSSFFYFSSIS